MDEPSPPSYKGPTSLRTIAVSRLLNIAATACSPKLAVRSRPTPDSFSADRTGSLVLSGPSPLLGQTSPAQHQHSTAQHSMLWTGATQPRISHYYPWALSCPWQTASPSSDLSKVVDQRHDKPCVSPISGPASGTRPPASMHLLRHCSTARRLSKLSMRVHVH